MALIITASIAVLALLGSIIASNVDTGPKKIDIKEVTMQDIKQDEDKPTASASAAQAARSSKDRDGEIYSSEDRKG